MSHLKPRVTHAAIVDGEAVGTAACGPAERRRRASPWRWREIIVTIAASVARKGGGTQPVGIPDDRLANGFRGGNHFQACRNCSGVSAQYICHRPTAPAQQGSRNARWLAAAMWSIGGSCWSPSFLEFPGMPGNTRGAPRPRRCRRNVCFNREANRVVFTFWVMHGIRSASKSGSAYRGRTGPV
jgi:hypothetical protein